MHGGGGDVPAVGHREFEQLVRPGRCHPRAPTPVRSGEARHLVSRYRSGSKPTQPPANLSGATARSTCSMAITRTTLAYAGMLVPVPRSDSAEWLQRCPASSAPIGSPPRVPRRGRDSDAGRRSSPNPERAVSVVPSIGQHSEESRAAYRHPFSRPAVVGPSFSPFPLHEPIISLSARRARSLPNSFALPPSGGV